MLKSELHMMFVSFVCSLKGERFEQILAIFLGLVSNSYIT